MNIDSTQAKTVLRKQYLQKRRMQDKNVAKNRARLAQSYILECAQWRKAKSVGLYMAIPSECGCELLLQTAWQTGKLVLLPQIIDRQSCIMRFAPCENINALKPGPMGILEPVGEFADNFVPEIIITPGIAFDRTGRRLGFGGGYYDRYLSRLPSFAPLLIGLCFSFQITDSLPADSWDIPMNAICSEDGLIWL